VNGLPEWGQPQVPRQPGEALPASGGYWCKPAGPQMPIIGYAWGRGGIRRPCFCMPDPPEYPVAASEQGGPMNTSGPGF
jgi:hypothetical protein